MKRFVLSGIKVRLSVFKAPQSGFKVWILVEGIPIQYFVLKRTGEFAGIYFYQEVVPKGTMDCGKVQYPLDSVCRIEYWRTEQTSCKTSEEQKMDD